MKTMIKYIVPALFLFFTVNSHAQEKLNGLQYQPTSSGKWLQPKNGGKMLLPFLDDFSTKNAKPDPAKWIDQEVYINNEYALYPPSYGVATLDALNGDGNFNASAGPFQYESDHLTSAFIDLSSLSPADSLYFSFRYQPQGRGNAPEEMDSLVLQFMEIYRKDTIIDSTEVPPVITYLDQWRTIWSASGSSIDSFFVANNNQYFKQVMIPVLDNFFYKADFRFRFMNYASLASNNIPSWQSNCDQWNLDLVYLNSGRSKNDTVFNDMCFVGNGSSFLKNFNAMPFRQFAADPAAEMRDSTNLLISNLGNDVLICRYRFQVDDMNGGTIFNYDGGNYNIDPFATSGYHSYKPHASPHFPTFEFPVTSTDSASFLIRHFVERIGASQELIKSNDSISFHQKFLNYYAYDDGMPEMGYGLSPAGSQMAYGFHVTVSDTLKGVLIAFNKTLNESNLKNFYLGLYKNNAGKPGDLIYRNLSARKASINDTSLFSYYAYDSDEPIILAANSTYYIGIIQTTDDNLNIGYDINNDAGAHIFFNVDGTWNKTVFSGSPMIRPIIGPSFQYKNKQESHATNELLVYPNPNTGTFRIQLPADKDIQNFQLRIFAYNGQMILDQAAGLSTTLSGIANGFYFLELRDRQSGEIIRGKMLLQQ